MLQPRSTSTPFARCSRLNADAPSLGQLRQGLISSRARPPRDHHHRQLPHVLHLPPAARRPHQQLVLRRPRQRTPRPDPRPRRPGRLASAGCQPGARRRVMTPSSQAAAKVAAFGIIKRRLHKFITIQFVVGIRLRVWYTLVIRVLIISSYPIRHPLREWRQSREQGTLAYCKKKLGAPRKSGNPPQQAPHERHHLSFVIHSSVSVFLPIPSTLERDGRDRLHLIFSFLLTTTPETFLSAG